MTGHLIFRVTAAIALLCCALVAGAAEEPAILNTPTGTLYGSLLLPDVATKPVPVVLVIAGSGPTDRDGNSAMLPGHNDSLRMLAQGLAQRGIASLRYDKRGIAASKAALKSMRETRFEDYVADARGWLLQLRADPRFGAITVAGHSEGSLIGMMAAADGRADRYVSLAGIARPAAQVVRDQVQPQLPETLKTESERIFVALESGQTVSDVPPPLMGLFNPVLQPYMISWFRYSGAVEIAKLRIPVLIVQGTTDAQVSVDEARRLAAASSGAKLDVIPGMNHILKAVTNDRETRFASYSDPALPVVPQLIDDVAAFVEQP